MDAPAQIVLQAHTGFIRMYLQVKVGKLFPEYIITAAWLDDPYPQSALNLTCHWHALRQAKLQVT